MHGNTLYIGNFSSVVLNAQWVHGKWVHQPVKRRAQMVAYVDSNLECYSATVYLGQHMGTNSLIYDACIRASFLFALDLVT
jgi:hypothetical protein